MSDAEVLGRDGPPAAALAAPHADPRQVSPWWLLLRLAYPAIGLGLLFTVWWIGARLIALDPHMQAFTSFAPEATLPAFWDLLTSNELIEAAIPSLKRIGLGLLWSIVIGVPVGVLIGQSRLTRAVTHLPFQFLRMISPLAWMPIAVMIFATWDGAIVFLVTAAAVWPVTYSTASGLRKLDTKWLKVARNLGASRWQMLLVVTMPAIAQDVLTGIRLALGVAWIILVPAEYLGVSSGLGYAINDARDTLAYDRLAALVLAIGIIGFLLDSLCAGAIRRWSWHEQDA
jgi:NitT/TauT family transport system permease protein